MSALRDSLGNQYFAMRHGQSQANFNGIIVSDPRTGCSAYGLTKTGRHQARDSASAWHPAPAQLHIYSSDFLRARETANLVHDTLQPPHPVTMTKLLRERYFGELEGQPDTAYQQVWSHDVINPGHTEQGVERVVSVAARATELLQQLECEHRDETILLVAHGDVLQILQTLFEGTPPCRHRELSHLQVAEIRALN